MAEIEVYPLTQEQTISQHYDVLICCVGYEQRARFVMQNVTTSRILAFAYDECSDFSYAENLKATRAAGAVICSALEDIAEKVSEVLQDCFGSGSRKLTVAFDISSMDRRLMGQVYLSLLERTDLWNQLSVLYAPSKFRRPVLTFLPIASEKPVLPQLIGRLRGPNVTSTMIVGLGHEYGVALGLIERFEPDRIFAFLPTGTDPRFGESIKVANFDFSFQPSPVIIRYDVTSPYQLFYNLYDIVRGLINYTEVIIAPGGPKIFSMISIIIGLMLRPNICVWRVSLSNPVTAGDVVAAGQIYGLSVRSTEMRQSIE